MHQNNDSIQVSIYLRAELNSQWPITESARMQTAAAALRQHRTKRTKHKEMNQLRLFAIRRELLKISVYLQIAFAVETYRHEGQ
jgi:hypothetical protein